MQKVIIIKYAELFLKGKNKGYFEQMFFVNIERALKGYKHTLRRPSAGTSWRILTKRKRKTFSPR